MLGVLRVAQVFYPSLFWAFTMGGGVLLAAGMIALLRTFNDSLHLTREILISVSLQIVGGVPTAVMHHYMEQGQMQVSTLASMPIVISAVLSIMATCVFSRYGICST